MEIVLQSSVLRWARERADLTEDLLANKLGLAPERVHEWENTGRIKFAHAEKLAKATYTPMGLLYLASPPEDRLPVPDFRTVGGAAPRRPSPNLLDVLDDALQRQDWFREYPLADREQSLDYVGSLSIAMPVGEAAARIRRRVPFDGALRAESRTWEEALTGQIAQIEESGVLVMRSGIVRSNTHRPLSVEEFRGFALADPYAPLIFLNGRDAVAAQMFTLAHELVHIWVGATGVSNLVDTYPVDRAEERFCNRVAAELLVPEDELRRLWPRGAARGSAACVAAPAVQGQFARDVAQAERFGID